MAALENLPLFDQYAGRGDTIIIAVSGGGDSMALLDLYRKANTPNLPVPYVITIDHGLRAGFSTEAAIVEAYCARHNFPWCLKRWEGDKPKTGIMAAARVVRYRLLADAAEAVGAKIILTGHTLDDQTETATMRGLRGASSHMDSDVLFQRRALISRPFLNFSRAELRAHLVQNRIAFADDPTNQDMRFERARVRKDAHRQILPTKISKNSEDLAERAAAFISRHVKREGNDVIIQRPLVHDHDAEVFGLRYLAATLGGFDYPAPKTVGERLTDLLNSGNKGEAFTAQRCCFTRIVGGVSVNPETRHSERSWLAPEISPFEIFCAKSFVPLANALAKLISAKAFLMP
jgi:tRNA(Ile)-lysidine synthase